MLALGRLRHLWRPRRMRSGVDIVALYALTPVGAAELSPRGRFLKTNAALQSFLGYSADELFEMDFDSATYSADIARCRFLFERLRRGELDHFQLDKRYVRKDGAIVWAHVIVTCDRRDHRRRIIGLAMDITERKRNEEALRQSEESYRSLYARTPVMMHSIDPQGRLLSVSDRWLSTLGYSREEVLGRRSVEFLTPESRRLAERTVLPRYFQTGECSDVPYTMVRKDGTHVEVLLSATSERAPDGSVARSLAVLLDVTERNRARCELDRLRRTLEERVRVRTEEVELRNALLAAMQETSVDGVLATDLKRRVLAYNRRLMEIWGATDAVAASGLAEDAARFALTLVVDPESFARRLAHLYTHRREKAFDEVLLRDGRTLERFSGPILGADGRPIGRVWYYRDITARKLGERQLTQRTAELARSNADLETYAYAASHDLSAPVRKISAYADLLRRSAGPKLDQKESSMLEVIERAARRMSSLIDDVLTLRRVGGDRPPLQPVALDEAVAHAISDMEVVIAEAGAAVSAGPLPRVMGQESLLRRLFQNLVSNGVKFRKPDAPCVVRIEGRPAEAGWAEIVVSDTGIGFEPRYKEKIFRPFLRLHPVGQYVGSGIGLAICRRIVQALGGTIVAAGEPGKGSTFTIRLRAAP